MTCMYLWYDNYGMHAFVYLHPVEPKVGWVAVVAPRRTTQVNVVLLAPPQHVHRDKEVVGVNLDSWHVVLVEYLAHSRPRSWCHRDSRLGSSQRILKQSSQRKLYSKILKT